MRESSWKNVVSELYRSQIERIFTGSESSQCGRSVRMNLDQFCGRHLWPKNTSNVRFLAFKKNVISEPPRPQIALRIAFSDSLRCRRPVCITFGRFRKNQFSTCFLHFARVTFQFSAQGLPAWKVSADTKAVSGRTFQNAPAPRAVLAGVAEKPPEMLLEDLNVPLAVGPSFFHDRPPGGECFAPFRSLPGLRLTSELLFRTPDKCRRPVHISLKRFRKKKVSIFWGHL